MHRTALALLRFENILDYQKIYAMIYNSSFIAEIHHSAIFHIAYANQSLYGIMVDYLMVAQAFGLQCHRPERHADIEKVLGKALAHNGPSFIEMPVVSQDIIAPFVPKWVQSARTKNIPNIY